MENQCSNIVFVESDVFNESVSKILEKKFLLLQKSPGIKNIGLSGGTTPIPILTILRESNIDWRRFQFFMVDERCVDVKSPDSNYGNIKQCFFDFIPAKSYSMVISGFSWSNSIEEFTSQMNSKILEKNKGIPIFDLILLGMGDDGHIASLFPSTQALSEEQSFVVKNYVPKLSSERITMTYPVLLNSKEIICIVKGNTKKELFFKLYESNNLNYPISKLVYSNINLGWIIEE